jgi:hypothetical protein
MEATMDSNTVFKDCNSIPTLDELLSKTEKELTDLRDEAARRHERVEKVHPGNPYRIWSLGEDVKLLNRALELKGPQPA